MWWILPSDQLNSFISSILFALTVNLPKMCWKYAIRSSWPILLSSLHQVYIKIFGLMAKLYYWLSDTQEFERSRLTGSNKIKLFINKLEEQERNERLTCNLWRCVYISFQFANIYYVTGQAKINVKIFTFDRNSLIKCIKIYLTKL